MVHFSNNCSMHLEVLIVTSVCGLTLLVIIIVLSYYIHSNVITIANKLHTIARINKKILKLVHDDIEENGGEKDEG